MSALTSLGIFLYYECIVNSLKKTNDKTVSSIRNQLDAKADTVKVGLKQVSPQEAQKIQKKFKSNSELLEKISVTQTIMRYIDSNSSKLFPRTDLLK